MFGHHIRRWVVAIVLSKMNLPFSTCTRLHLRAIELISDHSEGALAFRSPFTTLVIAKFIQELRQEEYPMVFLPIIQSNMAIHQVHLSFRHLITMDEDQVGVS